MASEMDVRFLGEIELDPRLGQCCDTGKSFLQHFPESRVSKAYRDICTGEHVVHTWSCKPHRSGGGGGEIVPIRWQLEKNLHNYNCDAI